MNVVFWCYFEWQHPLAQIIRTQIKMLTVDIFLELFLLLSRYFLFSNVLTVNVTDGRGREEDLAELDMESDEHWFFTYVEYVCVAYFAGIIKKWALLLTQKNSLNNVTGLC